MADGPYTLHELRRLVLPVPAPDSPAPCTYQFPTVHHAKSAHSLLLVTTKDGAARLTNTSPVPCEVLVLIVRSASVGWGEYGRALFHNYVEQRELQQLVGNLIVERQIGMLAVTADALTAGLRECWEAKYSADHPAPGPLRLTTSQPDFMKEERNGNCSI